MKTGQMDNHGKISQDRAGNISADIEFDGNTVLCRVCGDRASGFHYGVHACEGCKGFFRRSIQQKIQYRPCVKNQHCLITRVNRNRCQYCRLKKCIAIGMSRDAVRFGRVPKREKAKILEQMQKVNLQCCSLGSVELGDEVELRRRIIEAYEHTCQFTLKKAAMFKDVATKKGNYVSCPPKMACPLNPTPDVEYSSVDRWSLYSNGFMPAIHNIVTFAKLIPGFTNLNQDDQIALLKAGTFEILLLQLSCLFDSKSNVMFFTNEKIFLRRPHSPSSGAGYLLDSVFDFSERMMHLNLTDSEVALFSAFILLSPDKPGLHNGCTVERFHSVISQLLRAEVASNHPAHPDLHEKLLLKIPEMRLLNTVHSEKLLGLSVPSTIAQCSTLLCHSVPAVEHPCLYWTNQRRGLLLPQPVQCSYAKATQSDWQNNPQTPPTFNDENAKERKKRKLEGEHLDASGFDCTKRASRSETSHRELVVNGHQVPAYSSSEVVLCTPLGTFHRTSMAAWSRDRKPPEPLDRFVFQSGPHHLAASRKFKNKRHDPASPSSEDDDASTNANLLHHKKKVARVWVGDSASRGSSSLDNKDFKIKEPASPDDFFGSEEATRDPSKQYECDSTNQTESCNASDQLLNRRNPYGLQVGHDSCTGVHDGHKKKLFSDFNIKSRFLSYDAAKSPPAFGRAPRDSASTHSSMPYLPLSLQSQWILPRYALWPNDSVASVPSLRPPCLSASVIPERSTSEDVASQSFLDRPIGRDDPVSKRRSPGVPRVVVENLLENNSCDS